MAPDHASQTLFEDVVQPDALSLFSSTSSQPLALWAVHQDADLPEDSGVRLLVDASNEVALNDPGLTDRSFVLRIETARKGSSSEPVLHIQSPAIRNTSIRCPPENSKKLDIKLAHISFQYKSIGRSRPFSFEVGIKDEEGRGGTIRVSSFQAKPRLHLFAGIDQDRIEGGESRAGDSRHALLHLPLALSIDPEHDQTTLTAWQVVTLPLDRLAQHLSDHSLSSSAGSTETRNTKPFGSFHSISYVKVYANVRLRRVWCSRQLPDHDLPEFQLFS